jgi:hypothetical protein
MEAAISDLGTHALEEGLTSAQACLSISVLGIFLVLHGLIIIMKVRVTWARRSRATGI